MMVWSHFSAATTKAGYMPLDKEYLMEELLKKDSQFYEIVREREDIFHEFIVQKKITQGQY
jgi:hypothetical protein